MPWSGQEYQRLQAFFVLMRIKKRPAEMHRTRCSMRLSENGDTTRPRTLRPSLGCKAMKMNSGAATNILLLMRVKIYCTTTFEGFRL